MYARWRQPQRRPLCRPVSRYAVGGHFEPHRDKMALTVNILLADSEFEGGGTQFWREDGDGGGGCSGQGEEDCKRGPTLCVEPSAGVGVVFSGTVKHAGRAVTAGLRHLLVASFSIDPDGPLPNLASTAHNCPGQRGSWQQMPHTCQPLCGAPVAVGSRLAVRQQAGAGTAATTSPGGVAVMTAANVTAAMEEGSAAMSTAVCSPGQQHWQVRLSRMGAESLGGDEAISKGGQPTALAAAVVSLASLFRSVWGAAPVFLGLSALVTAPGCDCEPLHRAMRLPTAQCDAVGEGTPPRALPPTPQLPAKGSSGNDGSVFACCIALQDITLKMGPLLVLPNTHRMPASSPDDMLAAVSAGRTAVVPLTLKAGCVAVLDRRLVRCVSSNMGADWVEPTDDAARNVLLFFSVRARLGGDGRQ